MGGEGEHGRGLPHTLLTLPQLLVVGDTADAPEDAEDAGKAVAEVTTEAGSAAIGSDVIADSFFTPAWPPPRSMLTASRNSSDR